MKAQDIAGYSGSNKHNNNLETKPEADASMAQVPFPLGYQRSQEEENPSRVKNEAINKDALKKGFKNSCQHLEYC
jgi:hypothetical protein